MIYLSWCYIQEEGTATERHFFNTRRGKISLKPSYICMTVSLPLREKLCGPYCARRAWNPMAISFSLLHTHSEVWDLVGLKGPLKRVIIGRDPTSAFFERQRQRIQPIQEPTLSTKPTIFTGDTISYQPTNNNKNEFPSWLRACREFWNISEINVKETF